MPDTTVHTTVDSHTARRTGATLPDTSSRGATTPLGTDRPPRDHREAKANETGTQQEWLLISRSHERMLKYISVKLISLKSLIFYFRRRLAYKKL